MTRRRTRNPKNKAPERTLTQKSLLLAKGVIDNKSSMSLPFEPNNG